MLDYDHRGTSSLHQPVELTATVRVSWFVSDAENKLLRSPRSVHYCAVGAEGGARAQSTQPVVSNPLRPDLPVSLFSLKFSTVPDACRSARR